MNEGKCSRDCLYCNRSRHVFLSFHGCNYAAETGKSRVAAVYRLLGVNRLTKAAKRMLEPENCPCYRWDGKKKRKRKAKPLSFQRRGPDPIVMKKLWQAGMNDREIAREVKASEYVVGDWRRKQGLPVNRKPKPVYDWDKAEELYKQGRTDKEIAAALGCSEQSVWNWRNRKGIVSNQFKALKRIDYQKAMALYMEGLNDGQIAERVGAHKETILRWREKEGLPPNTERGGQRRKGERADAK